MQQDMAGGSDALQLPPLRDLSRRAASFLRMARLALTGAVTPAQLLAGEEVVDGLISCDPYYKSVSTEDDWESELWPEEDDDESELLVDDDKDGSTRRGASQRTTLVGGGGVGGPLNNKSQFSHRSATPPGSHVTAVEPEDPSELLMTRRATKRVNDDAVATVDHPFGCDRQGSESSSPLLLVSS